LASKKLLQFSALIYKSSLTTAVHYLLENLIEMLPKESIFT